MVAYIKNTEDLVPWGTVLKDLGTGKIRSPRAIWDDKSSNDNSSKAKEYIYILESWVDAGYNINTVYWVDYYPGENYSVDIDNTLAQMLDITVKRSWISKVDPGRVAPWHYDVEDRLDSWHKEGTVVRYTIFIDKPQWGSVFILEGTPFYNIRQGEIYMWDSPDQYHGAVACGGEPQFLYHVIGIKNG